MRRAVAGAFVVAVLTMSCLVGGVPAYAHNGVGAAFKGKAGPYVVYAYDGYPNPGGALAYRLVVVDAASGEPASDVAARVSAAPLRQTGTAGTTAVEAPAQVYANVVFYDLRNPYPGDWRVTVRLSGPAGRGQVSFPMHGIAPIASTPASPAYVIDGDAGGGPSWPLVAGGVVIALVVGGGVVAWTWRRRAARSSSSSSSL